DCIECGCCAYVCPSDIRLVDYYRFAKSSMRALEREKAAADAARERFEFRNQREERERAEKAARLAAKTAAGRQAAAGAAKAATPAAPVPAQAPAETPQALLDEQKKALIAAAIERARAQKEGVQPKNIDNLAPDKQAEIREIEMRRAKVRELAKTPPEEPV
ncbi:MAG: electron transport complex subunit RsxC, partial [Rhodocyclaceae bacterium]|nr:electron transport complex subunit RsxC [Rhodocyclaceae bacterium]